LKILLISPHRDDVPTALGLAIGSWLDQGHAVEVVECFTRTERVPFADTEMVHSNDRMSFATAVGRRESEEWRKRYGVSKLKLTDLNLKDAPLRLHCSQNEVLGLEPDRSEKVWSKVRLAIERSKAQAVVLPMGLKKHVDHVTVRDASLAVLTAETPVAFYEELPGFSAEEITEAVRGLSMSTRLELTPTFAGPESDDVEAAVKRKKRLAVCYDSQMDEATTQAIAEASRAYVGRERLWATPAWLAAFA
jgi:LmbE family N-acetylglucosaminyl deacetylase